MTHTRNGSLLILLIEDNPGDARLIREMLKEAPDVSDHLVQPDNGHGREATELLHEQNLSAGLETLEAEEIDVVLLDLNLPESRELDTLATVREHSTTVPIVVLTGLADRDIGIRALKRGAEEFLVKDEINGNLLVRSVYHAIERARYERALEQQRDQLEALNQLNTIVRDINHALVEQSTRQNIERIACERLAASDAYLFAWIAEIDVATRAISLRYEAGVEGSLDGNTISVSDGRPGSDPMSRAIETEQAQFSGDVLDDPVYEPWRDHARDFGYRSLAVIPITYQERVYGLLNVHATRIDAFDGPEGEIISQLGEIIGHAINAIERKEALMAEQQVVLKFRSEQLARQVVETMKDFSGTISIDRTIPLEDGASLQYCTVNGVSPEEFVEALEGTPKFTNVRLLAQTDDEVRFQVRTVGDTIASVFAGYGGQLRWVRMKDSEANIVADLPASIDISSVVTAVQSMYPDMELISKETVVEQLPTHQELRGTVGEQWTDRQRTVLETAFFAGYFDWPRGSTAEEVADSLGIAAPTFHEILRTAQRKLLREIVEEAPALYASD